MGTTDGRTAGENDYLPEVDAEVARRANIILDGVTQLQLPEDHKTYVALLYAAGSLAASAGMPGEVATLVMMTGYIRQRLLAMQTEEAIERAQAEPPS